MLLYAARLYTLHQERRWHFGRVRFKPEVERDFLQLGAIIAVGLVMEFIGFQFAMFAFVAVVLTALGWRRWGLTVILSCVLSFGVYHAFTRWLDVNLPQASIEILKRWGF